MRLKPHPLTYQKLINQTLTGLEIYVKIGQIFRHEIHSHLSHKTSESSMSKVAWDYNSFKLLSIYNLPRITMR